MQEPKKDAFANAFYCLEDVNIKSIGAFVIIDVKTTEEKRILQIVSDCLRGSFHTNCRSIAIYHSSW